MKCISVWSPWSSLIAIQAKRIETRGWSWDHRGLLAIHASKGGLSKREFESICAEPAFEYAFSNAGLKPSNLPRGAIVATCEMFECAPIINGCIAAHPFAIIPNPMEQQFGDYTHGRFAWLLMNIKPLLNPIPYRGAQGPFDVPDSLFPPEHLQLMETA